MCVCGRTDSYRVVNRFESPTQRDKGKNVTCLFNARNTRNEGKRQQDNCPCFIGYLVISAHGALLTTSIYIVKQRQCITIEFRVNVTRDIAGRFFVGIEIKIAHCGRELARAINKK